LECILHSTSLWRCIENEKLTRPPDEDDATFLAREKAFKADQQHVLTAIIVSVDHSHVQLLIFVKTGYHAWKTLERKHEPQDPVSTLLLITEFTNLTHNEYSNIDSFVARPRHLQLRLRTNSIDIKDEIVANKLVMSLARSLRSLADGYFGANYSKVDLNQLVNCLRRTRY